jgi:hypothetical protein
MFHLLKFCCIAALVLTSASTACSQIAYDFTWYYADVKYRTLLVPQDGDWFCRVRYVANGSLTMVDQWMEPKMYSDGLGLHGYGAVYSGTTVACPSYQPDNFLIYISSNGTARMFNLDNAGQKSEIFSITSIYTNIEYTRMLNTVFRQ